MCLSVHHRPSRRESLQERCKTKNKKQNQRSKSVNTVFFCFLSLSCCPYLHIAHQSQWSWTRLISGQIQNCRCSNSFHLCWSRLRSHHTCRRALCIRSHLVMTRQECVGGITEGNISVSLQRHHTVTETAYIHMQPYFFLGILTYTRHIVAVAKGFLSSAGEKSFVAKAGVLWTCVNARGIGPAQALVLWTLIDILKERIETKLH